MIKPLLLAATAVVAFSCATQAPSYTIDGTTNAFDGKVYLQVLEGKMPRTIDSTVVKDGKFAFAGQLEMPIGAMLADSTGRSLLYFYLENSPIAIVVDTAAKPTVAVSGSREDSLYRQFLVAMDTVTTEVGYNQTMTSFVEGNPKSVASAYVLFRMMSPGLESQQIRDYAAKFDSTIQKSIYLVKALERADLLDKTAVGTQFVDFQAADTLGNPVKLSSVAGQGKWVLLDFWASWCGPCRAENPHVVAAFEKYKDKNFTVFGVSLDKDKANWIKAIGKDGLSWTNVSDLKYWESAPAALYGVSSIPSNVLIAPDGKIAARNLRGDALTAKLDEVLVSND